MPDSTPKDLLTPKTAAIILAPFAAAVIAGRMHPEIVAPIGLAACAVGVAFCTERLEATPRMAVGTLSTIAVVYLTFVMWPWWTTWAAAVPFALAVFCIWCIGSGHGSKKRVVKRVEASLPDLIKAELPNGVVLGRMKEQDGVVSFPIKATSAVARGAMDGLQKRIATVIPGAKRGEVALHDLGNVTEEGDYLLEISQVDYHATGMTEPPLRPGKSHLGYTRRGRVASLDLFSNMAAHTLVGGMTGFGKSVFIRKEALDELEQGARVWFCDPHGTDERLIPHLERYEENGSGGAKFLADAVQLMRERKDEKTAKGNAWKPDSRIVIVIDELAAVLRYKGAQENLAILVEEGRKFGFRIVAGMQSPKATALGGGGVRGQFPVRVCFHVADGTESEAVLGKGWISKGYDGSNLKRQGEAYILLPGASEPVHVQCWPMRDPEVVLADRAPLSIPPNSSAPYAGEMEQDTGQDETQDGTWDPPSIATYGKWAEPVYNTLNGHPIVANQIVERLGTNSRQAVYDTLSKLERAGLARKDGKGWVRA